MSELEKYDEIFMRLFSVRAEQLDNLTYQSVPDWDSIGHMGMIAELEQAFGIEMETDDIIDFNSYNKGKEILLRYQINLI